MNRWFGFDYALLSLRSAQKLTLELVLKEFGATIGENSDIETGLTFHNCKNFKNLIIGDNTHIGKDCFFDLKNKVVLGKNVTVSMRCAFITHLDLGKSSLSKTYKASDGPILIQDNVYIGASSTILMNTVLHHRSMIAAGSVVNVSVPMSTLFAGVPIRKIKEIE